jgi:hypothetical protein
MDGYAEIVGYSPCVQIIMENHNPDWSRRPDMKSQLLILVIQLRYSERSPMGSERRQGV